MEQETIHFNETALSNTIHAVIGQFLGKTGIRGYQLSESHELEGLKPAPLMVRISTRAPVAEPTRREIRARVLAECQKKYKKRVIVHFAPVLS